jgi:hypothetical protein
MEGGDGAEKAGVNETAASARRRGANEATSHPNSINLKRRIQYRTWASNPNSFCKKMEVSMWSDPNTKSIRY